MTSLRFTELIIVSFFHSLMLVFVVCLNGLANPETRLPGPFFKYRLLRNSTTRLEFIFSFLYYSVVIREETARDESQNNVIQIFCVYWVVGYRPVHAYVQRSLCGAALSVPDYPMYAYWY